MQSPLMADIQETHVAHVGWLRHRAGDDVAVYLRQGWFEYREQAFLWLYLRPGNVVVDCGAHLGLFSLLSAAVMGDDGVVIAVEPDPANLTLLRENIRLNDRACIRVIDRAAWSEVREMTLHVGMGTKSAYGSLVVEIEGGGDVTVRTDTIDGILAELDIERADFLKIDVEGAEVDVWQGCARLVAADAVPLVMVEFTEANQTAVGRSTADVARAWENNGYSLYRFDEESLQLVPAEVCGSIEYENLFAARDVEPINARLREVSQEHRRIATEILQRGRTAFELLKRACDAEYFMRLGDKRTIDVIRTSEGRTARMRRYARYIHRYTHSVPVRIARALRLVNLPEWIDQVEEDMKELDGSPPDGASEDRPDGPGSIGH